MIEEVVQKTVDVALPPPDGTEIEQLDGFELLSVAEATVFSADRDGQLSRAPLIGMRHSSSCSWKP